MQLPHSCSEDMSSNDKNEIVKGQEHMFIDYRLTFLLQILAFHFPYLQVPNILI